MFLVSRCLWPRRKKINQWQTCFILIITLYTRILYLPVSQLIWLIPQQNYRQPKPCLEPAIDFLPWLLNYLPFIFIQSRHAKGVKDINNYAKVEFMNNANHISTISTVVSHERHGISIHLQLDKAPRTSKNQKAFPRHDVEIYSITGAIFSQVPP